MLNGLLRAATGIFNASAGLFGLLGLALGQEAALAARAWPVPVSAY
jgi:hypothetical protein